MLLLVKPWLFLVKIHSHLQEVAVLHQSPIEAERYICYSMCDLMNEASIIVVHPSVLSHSGSLIGLG